MVNEGEAFDLVVIGAGPGGYGAALYGAAAGLNVAIVEMNKLGGTCLHVGCIPAKELLETATVLRTVREAAEFGVNTSKPSLDISTTMARKQRVVDQLSAGVEQLLDGRDVTVFDGVGKLGERRKVSISGGQSGDLEISGRNVVLASGSRPRTIPGFEVDGKIVVTSDELLSIDRVPASVAIIGGGAIGCEFASALADFGAQVTILEALPNILTGCDPEVSRVVERSFKKRGISIKTGIMVSGHTPHDDGTVLDLGDSETLEVEMIVISAGRRPFPDLLGLEGSAVQLNDQKFVLVDDFCRTHEPGVYALGDLVDTPQLAHVGFAEAIMVIKDILGEEARPVDYGKVPWAIYCQPEVAFAGLTETAAIKTGYEVIVSKHRFAGNGRALIVGGTEGMVKVVVEKLPDGSPGQFLGVHMVGPWVTEQIAQGYLAVNWEATVDEVAEFIQPHPTFSELFGESVLALTGRSLHA